MLKRRVELLVDDEIMDFLKAIAERLDRSRGYVIRSLIIREAEGLGLRQKEKLQSATEADEE